jgi:predicted small secreted protein
MRAFITVVTLVSLTTLIAACNTMAGAGEDMQSGGKKLENSADRNK